MRAQIHGQLVGQGKLNLTNVSKDTRHKGTKEEEKDDDDDDVKEEPPP